MGVRSAAMSAITWEDLQPVLAVHQGAEALRRAVDGAGTPPHLLSVIARYIQFNSGVRPRPREPRGRDRGPPGSLPGQGRAGPHPWPIAPRRSRRTSSMRPSTSSTIGPRRGATPIARWPRPPSRAWARSSVTRRSSSTTCSTSTRHRRRDGPRLGGLRGGGEPRGGAALPRHGVPHRQRDPGRPGVRRARQDPARETRRPRVRPGEA